MSRHENRELRIEDGEMKSLGYSRLELVHKLAIHLWKKVQKPFKSANARGLVFLKLFYFFQRNGLKSKFN